MSSVCCVHATVTWPDFLLCCVHLGWQEGQELEGWGQMELQGPLLYVISETQGASQKHSPWLSLNRYNPSRLHPHSLWPPTLPQPSSPSTPSGS